MKESFKEKQSSVYYNSYIFINKFLSYSSLLDIVQIEPQTLQIMPPLLNSKQVQCSKLMKQPFKVSSMY